MSHVDSILKQMTLAEKVAQLQGLLLPHLFDFQPPSEDGKVPGGMRVATERLDHLRPHGLGHLSMAWFAKTDSAQLKTMLEQVQTKAREISRFGIGVLVHGEGINGLVHTTGLQYPTAWAQASTWMPELVEQSAQITASQMRDAGFQLCFSPVLDIARDPRWGRVHETYGEDVELVSQMGVAFVRGINGANNDSGVTATGKHFLGYAVSEGGLNQARTTVGKRELIDQHSEPFRRAIDEAGLRVVMNSYNEIDGVPAAANSWLLKTLLREDLGFGGLVVSDYDAIKMLLSPYHVARNEREAGTMALSAGIDVELPANDTYSHLVDAVENGELPEEVVDTATRRVLETKRDLGLIPALRPRVPHAPKPDLDVKKSRRIAREIATNATTLLTNDGTLPLHDETRIAIVGSLANELRVHFGAYTDVSNDEQPMAINMIRNRQVPTIDPDSFNFTDIFQARIPGIASTFEKIARALYPGAPSVLQAIRKLSNTTVKFVDVGSPDSLDPISRDLLEEQLEDVDVIVAVLGERTGWLGNNSAGEGQTTARNELPGNQLELLETLSALDLPVVSVIISARPLILSRVVEYSNAILLAPLLGGVAGDTIADVLLGSIDPGGRLPSTFPRHMGQIPLYHSHSFGSGYEHPTGKRHPYNDQDPTPLFSFGHGLSYTTFEVKIENTSIDSGHMHTHCTVTNTGARQGSTVVQIYVRDEHGSIVRPVRQLVDFSRVSLEPGESRTIDFEWPLTRLQYTLPDGTRILEHGDVMIMAALSSDDIRDQEVIVVNELRSSTPAKV